MRKLMRPWWLAALLLAISLVLALTGRGTQAEEPLPPVVTGNIFDRQGQPVAGAEITLHATREGDPLSEATTQPKGLFALILPEAIPGTLIVHIERAHF